MEGIGPNGETIQDFIAPLIKQRDDALNAVVNLSAANSALGRQIEQLQRQLAEVSAQISEPTANR